MESLKQLQPIKQIIVGIDFSKYSKTVIKEAQKLSETMNVPWALVYVYDYFQTLGGTIEEFELRTRKQIVKIYNLEKDLPLILRMGDPATQLVEFAKKQAGTPLIMVGYKGHSKIAHFFLGSTAEKVATLSPFPVWIHRGNRTLLPKRVLVPSDFTEQTDRALTRVKLFESTFHPALELYHVIPDPMPILDFPVYSEVYKSLHDEDDKLFAEFQKTHAEFKTVRGSGNVIDKIEKRSKRFDLIALSPHGKNKVTPLLGKVATKLVRTGNKPVLICP